jgi:hypothetical protein
MTTLPSTLPAELRGAMHELTHHHPKNTIADAAMLQLPEDLRAEVAACFLGNNADAATKAIIRRFGGLNVAVLALDTLETGGLVEVLRDEIGKLDRTAARTVFADLIKEAGQPARGSSPISAVTEDGAPIVTFYEGTPPEYLQIREMAAPEDFVHKYKLLRRVTEHIVPGGTQRQLAVYRDVTETVVDDRGE